MFTKALKEVQSMLGVADTSQERAAALKNKRQRKSLQTKNVVVLVNRVPLGEVMSMCYPNIESKANNYDANIKPTTKILEI